MGAKVRNWWWKVNNWKLPEESRKVAEAREFFVNKFGSGGD